MPRTPTIKPGPSSSYTRPGEAIREFSDGESGGLISIHRTPDGKLRVEVYRCDADVQVLAPEANLIHRDPPPWRVANNGVRGPRYFLVRSDDGWPIEYHRLPTGRLRRYQTAENAQQVADKLNRRDRPDF